MPLCLPCLTTTDVTPITIAATPTTTAATPSIFGSTLTTTAASYSPLTKDIPDGAGQCYLLWSIPAKFPNFTPKSVTHV
jgi:hypothetical protein